jgi:hypothetical protein
MPNSKIVDPTSDVIRVNDVRCSVQHLVPTNEPPAERHKFEDVLQRY